MTNYELKQQIAELRHSLEQASETDVHVRDMLGSLMEDIVVLVSENDEGEVDSQAVRSQLDQQAADFESRHPKIAGLLRQLMDQLAKLGI
ncbi:DUF4404 family protein [Porticoccus sp. W117]|uniref:DUF4404 family protein n=1 Tax=Porticoccus sp. W117 TaxID=3054777 RepID=UPI0025995C5B|nr:DUF4404 family protein [Porticoccus sp. W117]MDM3871901.1 DUF4404 family protein [Porticoccus sp. W117]